MLKFIFRILYLSFHAKSVKYKLPNYSEICIRILKYYINIISFKKKLLFTAF